MLLNLLLNLLHNLLLLYFTNSRFFHCCCLDLLHRLLHCLLHRFDHHCFGLGNCGAAAAAAAVADVPAVAAADHAGGHVAGLIAGHAAAPHCPLKATERSAAGLDSTIRGTDIIGGGASRFQAIGVIVH